MNLSELYELIPSDDERRFDVDFFLLDRLTPLFRTVNLRLERTPDDTLAFTLHATTTLEASDALLARIEVMPFLSLVVAVAAEQAMQNAMVRPDLTVVPPTHPEVGHDPTA